MMVEPDSDVQPDQDASGQLKKAGRELSKLLCGGAQYRLELGAAISDTPLVNTKELATKLGLSRQAVNKELHILRDAGLLEKREDDLGGRHVYFGRVDCAYWGWCAEAVHAAPAMLERARRL